MLVAQDSVIQAYSGILLIYSHFIRVVIPSWEIASQRIAITFIYL